MKLKDIIKENIESDTFEDEFEFIKLIEIKNIKNIDYRFGEKNIHGNYVNIDCYDCNDKPIYRNYINTDTNFRTYKKFKRFKKK